MDHLVRKLQGQARAHPSNPVLRRILSEFHHLLNGARFDPPDVQVKYDQLQKDLGILATQGLWEPSKEDEDSLRQLKRRLGLSRVDGHDSDSTDGVSHTTSRPSSRASKVPLEDPDRSSQSKRDISIVQPPSLSTPLLPVSTLTPTVLPIELVQTLNHTFFLHLLATDPERVLPPGKSLLSMMSGPRTATQSTEGELPKLEDRVKDMVHRAFWKEVRVLYYLDGRVTLTTRIYAPRSGFRNAVQSIPIHTAPSLETAL